MNQPTNTNTSCAPTSCTMGHHSRAPSLERSAEKHREMDESNKNDGDSSGDDGSSDDRLLEDDITLSVRLQIKNDDPDLTKLKIGPNEYLPRGNDNWAKDGISVGKIPT